MSIAGKRLLILGGTFASLDLVKMAKSMGVYTIVTDMETSGVAKDLADETAMVSTADIDALAQLCKDRKVDGVFCGPSEFNLRNVIRLCEKMGYPCYTDMQTWDNCANKNMMKDFCRRYGVDCPAEYDVSEDSPQQVLDRLEYPVIVKPVDSSSSNGVTVCQNAAELRAACAEARKVSKSGKIIVEQYIENGGELFSVRYLIRDGEMIPCLTIDDYIVDPITRKSLISGFLHIPSKYTQYFLDSMDANVRKMLYGMGLRNGTVFMQGLPYKGKIYLVDMGFRLGGGMIFKVTEPLMGVNDMKMMIRYALGGPMYKNEEITKIKFMDNPKRAGQLTVPLTSGVIARVEGMEACAQIEGVTDVLVYHNVGDEITPSAIGNLAQLFCRFTMVADTTAEIVAIADKIQQTLRVFDAAGNRLNVIQTDFARMNNTN